MRFLLATLSWSYLRRHRAKTLLTLLGVVVGVATFAAIQAARGALVGGLRSTVDRIAGKAQLEVVADGGVPEELQEALREVAGVVALAPVIEQVVVPERGELGSVLVLGVDLLGDHEMRDYGFEGDDADLDDPLLFLAQPDSVALTRQLAARAGSSLGGTFVFRAPAGAKRTVVRGLLEPKGFAEAFAGNLAVMDVYAAQSLFGRGRRFDRIELRLEEGSSLEEMRRRLASVVGPGYQVETPSRRGEHLEKVISNFIAGFSITSVFALGIGSFLIYNAFTVSVHRRRRDIGTLRALGATPRQVQALFLVEAAVIGLAGALLGLLAGSLLAGEFLKAMTGTAETLYGVLDVSQVRLDAPTVAQAIVLGLLASLAGAWLPSRAAARVRPTEALAKGAFSLRVPGFPKTTLAAGALLLAAATGIALLAPRTIASFAAAFALGLAGAVLISGPLARRLLTAVSPLLARLSPVTGRLAADALLGNPRRASGTIVAMTISLAFVLGTAGYMGSTIASLEEWMAGALTADIYVRGSASLTRPDFRFPPELRDELLAIPGVRAVESYRALRIPYRGRQISLRTIEIEPMLARTSYEFRAGSEETMMALVSQHKVAVSDNFPTLFGVGLGDEVELATPAGVISFPVVAVVRDLSDEHGALYMDRATFLELWRDDRVDYYDLSLHAGVDPTRVREAIHARVAGRMPALVSTRTEFVAEIGRAIDAFYVLTRVTIMLALLVALLGTVTSLLISVAERTREIGILKALGALAPQIRRSVVLEALAVAAVSLLLAIPLGALHARFTETVVTQAFTGWTMPGRYPWAVLAEVAVALPLVSLLAALFPARTAAATPVVEAIEYE